jgi:hypothetical protein
MPLIHPKTFLRVNTSFHYYRIGHHCRPHYCRIWVNHQWCTFTAGSELENHKMIRVGPKLAVKVHIATCLWLEPAVSWWPLITTGSSQERQWFGAITVSSSHEQTMIKWQYKRLAPSSPSSSLPSQAQRHAFGPLPPLLRLLFIIKLALGFWRWLNLFASRLVTSIHSFDFVA